MLESQRNIERKKYIWSAIQALSDNVPLIFEALSTGPLKLRRNTKQLSLSGAVSAIKKLQCVQGTTSLDIKMKYLK